MTVTTVDPKQPAISMTESACAYLQEQVKTRKSAGLRLAVKESGCSGFKYVFDFVEESNENDTHIMIDERVKVFVAKDALPYVFGTKIDYVTEGLNHSIKFINPNIAAECGCGESFSI